MAQNFVNPIVNSGMWIETVPSGLQIQSPNHYTIALTNGIYVSVVVLVLLLIIWSSILHIINAIVCH